VQAKRLTQADANSAQNRRQAVLTIEFQEHDLSRVNARIQVPGMNLQEVGLPVMLLGRTQSEGYILMRKPSGTNHGRIDLVAMLTQSSPGH
jgi:hypothetical protein